MRIPGIKTFRRAGQWIHSRFSKHALILGYHRVAEKSNDLYGTCVTPNHFQEQMEVLQHFTQILSLQELVICIKKGRPPNRSVAITFDDGYSEILYTVKPLLEYYHLPSTVFIITGCLGQEFWWDELERLLSERNVETYATIWPFYQQLLSLPLEDRQRTMWQLREQAAKAPIESEISRSLTLDELGELANGKLIEIGAHGVNHISLAQLDVDAQKSELLTSKAFLENHLGKHVYSFSYPNGVYTSTTQRLAYESGYRCACRSKPGVVFQNSNLYDLPRFWVPDWDGSTFKRWLLKWL